MQGAGRKQAFHQANYVERLESLLASGPVSYNQPPKNTMKKTVSIICQATPVICDKPKNGLHVQPGIARLYNPASV